MVESIKSGNFNVAKGISMNLMKIFVNHFLVFNIIFRLPIKYPGEVTEVFSFLSYLSPKPSPNEVYSLECFLRDLNWKYGIPHYLFLKTIFSYLLVIFLGIFVSYLI